MLNNYKTHGVMGDIPTMHKPYYVLVFLCYINYYERKHTNPTAIFITFLQTVHSHCNNKYFFLSFLITSWVRDYHFSFYHKMASQDDRTIPCIKYVKYHLFWASFSWCENPDDHSSSGSGHVIPHFFVFFFWLRFPFYTPCHMGGAKNCTPTWDTMYPCIDYREKERYAQLCLPWIPRNLSLWIPLPTVSLYFSDVRFATWTYPFLVLLLYDSMHAMLLCMLLCPTPTFS